VQPSASTLIEFDTLRNQEAVMTDTGTGRGGFAGDPAAALDVGGTSGCCGTAPRSALALPDPADGSPCCGSPAEAAAQGSCCGSTAKAGAVASGQGCCG
jgi:hypothetical protein